MSPDYYSRLPRLLQDELSQGRWLPVVGAGMSANASDAAGRRPPLWGDLGSQIGGFLPPGFGADGAVDAISNLEQQYGRLPLVDKLRDLLLVDHIRPGPANRAFAEIPFDTVVTTNIDFVLEDAWRETGWPFDAIIGEQRLAARRRTDSTLLVKFHGDVTHPDELIVTENDYDGFLRRSPLLSTFVASLLITRVPVLFGYSAEDPDFRALLSLLSDRLGRNRSTPWVILARATDAQVARYERRGVKPVVLETRRKIDQGEVFEAFFRQIAEALREAAGTQAESTEDELLSGLRSPSTTSAMVLFVGSNEALAQHRRSVFPELRSRGLNPVTPDEVQSIPSMRLASLSQLAKRASAVVVDTEGLERSASSQAAMMMSTIDPSRLIVIGTRDDIRGIDVANFYTRPGRSEEPGRYPEFFALLVSSLVKMVQPAPASVRVDSIRKRLSGGDATIALLEAVIALEAAMRQRWARGDERRPAQMRDLLSASDLRSDVADQIREAYDLRSEYLHHAIEPPQSKARELTLVLLSVLVDLS